MTKRNKQNSFTRIIKKIIFSAFVLFSFIAYALESHGNTSKVTAQANGGIIPTVTGETKMPAETPAGAAASSDAPTSPAGALATDVPVSPASSGYKDGTYTGPVIDVNWGNVQVQAMIQRGKISNVQFLDFPQDRNTSRRINSFAVPVLQQEAIQAQTANVDIITGATLTSEGFQMSLQAALSQAKG